jgi:hypothetical protein
MLILKLVSTYYGRLLPSRVASRGALLSTIDSSFVVLNLTNILLVSFCIPYIPTSVPVDVLKTHPKYDAIQREYQQLVQSIESSKVTQQAEEEEEKDNADDPRMPATVVDFFAGIGSGTVALKRLGIAIEKVSG